MKQKEWQEHKNKAAVELEKEMHGLRERLNQLRFDLAAGKVKNIREIRHIKKGIAQILTILKEKK